MAKKVWEAGMAESVFGSKIFVNTAYVGETKEYHLAIDQAGEPQRVVILSEDQARHVGLMLQGKFK